MSIIDDASNIITGENPPYTVADFLSVYPGFGEDSEGNKIVPETIIEMFIGLADASIKQARYHSYWSFCMGLFIAHFVSLWLQGTADPNSGASAVIAAGEARGLKSSKAVAGVSVSYDFGSIANDLDGWAAWKLTKYGLQLATIGKLVGKGGMYIY